MAYVFPDVRKLSVGATLDTLACDFTEWLDSGETISSVTITEVDTNDLSLSSKVANSAAITVNEQTVAIGKGAQCNIDASSAVAGVTYRLLVTPTTSASRVVPFVAKLEAV